MSFESQRFGFFGLTWPPFSVISNLRFHHLKLRIVNELLVSDCVFRNPKAAAFFSKVPIFFCKLIFYNKKWCTLRSFTTKELFRHFYIFHL